MSAHDTVRPGWRVRAIRRKMSFETFERTIPVRPGWKREYYGGIARVRPSWTMVTFELDVAPLPVPPIRGLRPIEPNDAAELIPAFLDAFRFAPEYAAYTMKDFRAKATEYVNGFFGDIRGTWSRASTVVVRRGQIAAAALIKDRKPKAPLLDCLFVRPPYFRRGLATAVTTRAVNEMAAAGFTKLRSSALLANEASLAWHDSFGFRELPDVFVAQARYFSAAYERERLEKFVRLTAAERVRLTALVERWEAEWKRLEELPIEHRFPGRHD
jgi:ribosomal protein S18 acetylase RimI-like enzyme